ncbi:Alkaline phosphatase synthesis sensor protein PhoR [compost metagenome]
MEKKDYIFEEKEISYVLNGNTYKSFNYKRPVDSQIVVGVPFTNQGQRYALFLTPEFVDGVSIFTDVTRTILLIVLALGSVFILIASGYIVKPLRKLTEATKRLAQGDFDVHVAMKKKDELGTLASSFNHMAQELKQLERMRQNFVSNVSHEIQTPLTSIRGFSKVLRDPKLSEVERLHYLNIIETESERLSRLSDNLLKLASLESEHHPFHRTEISLDEQLRKIVVACEPLWSAKDLTLELDLTKTVLLGDEDQLNQVWTNLLHNCVKFTPHGGIIRIDIQQKMNAIEVIFQDNGIGISVEEQERIFQRFYKADASRQSIQGGSGLGLAIVKKIVDIHRGSVSVTSAPGQGSTFTVYLPTIR